MSATAGFGFMQTPLLSLVSPVPVTVTFSGGLDVPGYSGGIDVPSYSGGVD